MGKVSEILGGLGALIGFGFGLAITAGLIERSTINEWIVWLPIFAGIAGATTAVGVFLVGDIIPTFFRKLFTWLRNLVISFLNLIGSFRNSEEPTQDEQSTERTENPHPELQPARD